MFASKLSKYVNIIFSAGAIDLQMNMECQYLIKKKTRQY